MEVELFDLRLNLAGVGIGGFAFLIIMAGRYSCIAGEYYFSKKLWLGFLAVGVLALTLSLLLKNFYLSAMLSILGFTYLWGIPEIIQQEERVKKGWFPANPRKVNRR